MRAGWLHTFRDVSDSKVSCGEAFDAGMETHRSDLE